MAPARAFHYLLQPFHLASLLIVIPCSLLLPLAAINILGIPLEVFLIASIWSYAYAMVDHLAHGRPVPVLSVEMINPWHEWRPLGQVVLLAAVVSFAWWLDGRGLRPAAIGVVAFAIALFPASLALLSIEGSLLRAASPLALLGIARALGSSYALLVAVAWCAGGLLWLAQGRVPAVIDCALAQCLLLMLASLLGGALYERRDALGLEVYESPERSAARAARLSDRDRDREVDQIYALVRARELTQALTRLEAVLGPRPVDPETYRWLRDRAASWEDGRIADRLTTELIARLVALGRRGEALLVAEDWWQRGRRFPAPTTRDLELLERVAADVGHAATRERLQQEREALAARAPPTR